MKTWIRIMAAAVVGGAILAVLIVKQYSAGQEKTLDPLSKLGTTQLPSLVEFGSVECIPCKMMEPELEKLHRERGDRVQVIFVDVKKDPATAKKHEIRLIPTQVFFDASGKELWRHPGFFGRDEIVAKWKELGWNLDGASSSTTSSHSQTR